MKDIAYKRILLKLSGEALAGEKKTGIDSKTVGKICDKMKLRIGEDTHNKKRNSQKQIKTRGRHPSKKT